MICPKDRALPGFSNSRANIVYWKITDKRCNYRRLSNKITQPECQYQHIYYYQELSEPWCRGLQVGQMIPGILFIDGVSALGFIAYLVPST